MSCKVQQPGGPGTRQVHISEMSLEDRGSGRQCAVATQMQLLQAAKVFMTVTRHPTKKLTECGWWCGQVQSSLSSLAHNIAGEGVARILQASRANTHAREGCLGFDLEGGGTTSSATTGNLQLLLPLTCMDAKPHRYSRLEKKAISRKSHTIPFIVSDIICMAPPEGDN